MSQETGCRENAVWKKAIVDKSFCVIGMCHTGKTFVIAATAWKESGTPRKIAVVRQGEHRTIGQGTYSALLPFNERGLDILEQIVDSEKEYAVFLETGHYQSREDLSTAARRLEGILFQIQENTLVLFDSFEAYGTPVLTMIGRWNPKVVPGYCCSSVSSIKAHLSFPPSADTVMYLRTVDTATVNHLERVLKNREVARRLWNATRGQYTILSGRRLISGVIGKEQR